MKIKPIRRTLLFWTILLVTVIANGQPPGGPMARSPQVHPDNTVTFQFIAPGANDVKLSAQFEKGPEILKKPGPRLDMLT
jgi:hypothetical protein